EREDPHGDQEQKVQVEEAPVDARAVLEKGVVIHPDDADREEAHEVRRVGRPEAQERGGQIGRVSWHAELQDEQRRRDREDAVAEGLEPTRAHRPSLNEPPEGLPDERFPPFCLVDWVDAGWRHPTDFFAGGGWDGELAYARRDRDRVRRYPRRGGQAPRIRGAFHGRGRRGLERDALERDALRISVRGALRREGGRSSRRWSGRPADVRDPTPSERRGRVAQPGAGGRLAPTSGARSHDFFQSRAP